MQGVITAIARVVALEGAGAGAAESAQVLQALHTLSRPGAQGEDSKVPLGQGPPVHKAHSLSWEGVQDLRVQAPGVAEQGPVGQ